MRYSLEELRESRDLFREIRALEQPVVGSPVHDPSFWTQEKREEHVDHGKKAWTEERRKAQSELMKGNARARKIPLGPKTKEETELDIALAPRPEGSTLTKLVKNYHCSICNGIGHNARTCTVLRDVATHGEDVDDPSHPPSEVI